MLENQGKFHNFKKRVVCDFVVCDFDSEKEVECGC